MSISVQRLHRHGAARLCIAVLACTTFVAGGAIGQERSSSAASATATTKELVDGAELMDAYIQALGGAEAMEKIDGRRSEGKMEIKALGMEGSVLLLQGKPDRFLMSMELKGIGKVETGSNGDVVWENSVVSGKRVIEGEEREQAIRRMGLTADLHWRELYKSAKTVGEGKVGDRDVWIVELTPVDDGKPQTNYFDKETHLLLRMKATLKTPMGDIAIDSQFLDYRTVDGIQMPFESRQSLMGQNQVLKLTKVEHVPSFAANAFDPPKETSAGK